MSSNEPYKFVMTCRVYTDQVVKRIQDLPAIAIANKHATVPILTPIQHDLPFAMSLEICNEETCFQPSKIGLDHPMCELLYFLEGSGLVTVLNDGQDGSVLEVNAGDSVLAAAQTMCVQQKKRQAASTCANVPVTFVRVILPLKYVVGNAHNPQIAKECRIAAAKVAHRQS